MPLLIREDSSDVCRQVWDASDAVVCNQLAFVEAAAALARAQRLGRMTIDDHAASLQRLDRTWEQCDIVAVDEPLVRAAAILASDHSLRGYDAVHCASAFHLADPDVVAVSGDQSLLAAWAALGVATIDTLA